MMRPNRPSLFLLALVVGCSGSKEAPPGTDAAPADAGNLDQGDSSPADAGAFDGGPEDSGVCQQASLPTGSPSMIVAAAGAPIPLFGDSTAPTFESAFAQLAAAGFNAFFPWFGTSEIDGQATVTPHFDYFLPVGARPCTLSNPYSAARPHLGILFPAFFFSNATGDQAFDPGFFRDQYANYRDQCWGGDDSVIRAFQSFDEIVSQRIVNQFFNNPGPRLLNTVDAANLIHELSDKPVILIEGPLPSVIQNEAGLTPIQREQLTQDFWAGVDVAVEGADIFGFDVYPVPDFPLTLPTDYQREADTRAPNSQRISVLQGFSYDAETNGMNPGRGPTLTEHRFMAFDAIAAGVDHLVWYGASALDLDVEEQAQIWADVLSVVGVVSKVAAAVEQPATEIAAPPGVRIVSWPVDGGFLLIFLNRTGASINTGAVQLPFSPHSYFDLDRETTIIAPPGSRFGAELDAWEVKLYLASTCSP